MTTPQLFYSDDISEKYIAAKADLNLANEKLIKLKELVLEAIADFDNGEPVSNVIDALRNIAV